jgi:hypothetical protein
MRLFQNSGIYPAYLPRLNRLSAKASSFRERLDVFLDDRYGACHFLQPVLQRTETAFFTNGDDVVLQRLWAQENGLAPDTPLHDILLAQIEHHRTEVFYNMDPMRVGNAFLRRLPGCVRKTIAWRAAPSAGGEFGDHDLLVCNFPGILQGYRDQGWKAEYFFPAHDPEMDPHAANMDRPIDVLFVGGYSRHHRQRAVVLEAVAALAPGVNVRLHLDRGRLTRLAESLPGRLLPLEEHRRPAAIRATSRDPIFGRELYEAISRSKIVLNGAVDMAGQDRGNMRCFEAMGCGALLVSDAGVYPDGMRNGSTMLTYATPGEAVARIREALADHDRLKAVAAEGLGVMQTKYSKAAQWAEFRRLVELA